MRVHSMSASYDEAQGLYEMWTNQLQEHFLSVAEMRPHCLDLTFVAEGDNPLKMPSRRPTNPI